NIAATITEVSERATVLVREEIELAKAEVSEKVTKLVRGAAVGAAAGVFVLTALVFALIGCAWLRHSYLPGNASTSFWGFFASARRPGSAARSRNTAWSWPSHWTACAARSPS